MQPVEENTFSQVPWFATTQTGSIDLYASAISRYSSNLNHSNTSNNKENTKLSNKKNSTNGSTRSLKAWSGIGGKENIENGRGDDSSSSKVSLRGKRNSFTKTISNSRLSLKKLLNKEEEEETDRQTIIEPLDPIMSYSSQNQIEPSQAMVSIKTGSGCVDLSLFITPISPITNIFYKKTSVLYVF